METAHRIYQRISSIFSYGVALRHASADPAASLAVALPKKPRAKPQPAITTLAELQQMLADCEAAPARAFTKFALRLLALTAVRPGELRLARWAEFENLTGKEPLWRIPADRMKGDQDRKAEIEGDHLVPLAPEAVGLLLALRRFSGNLELVFPSDRHVHRPISENTLRALLIRAGYYQRHVPHGFRAAVPTIMNERAERHWRQAGHIGVSPDRAIIDLMLTHVPTNEVESVYNRATYMARRREIAAEWARLVVEKLPPPEAHFGRPMR